MSLRRLNSFLDWSVGVGRVFGIPIRLHITLLFFLLPAFRSLQGGGFWYAAEWALLVVLSILLHEFGHALAAKKYKLGGLSIMLHGFGGFAMSYGARTAKQDLVIVLCGPAVTFAIAGTCYLTSSAIDPATLEHGALLQWVLLSSLARFNLLIGFLNLIPSLPFDGGGALRAILKFRIPEHKAVRRVGHLGLLVTPPVVIYGFLNDEPYLGLFGLIGLVTSYVTLSTTGGIRFFEAFRERRERKADEAVRKRKAEEFQSYLDQVKTREKEREERERLKRLFEVEGED